MRPQPLGDRRRHLMRVRRMAKIVGADPAAARQAGVIEHADWAEIVARCRTCGDTAGCDRWLNTHEESPDAMPGCLNGDILKRLKP
ncbi:hypothetical protein FIU97_00440 [Roseivivax sp. THAF40]|uniref:DUF6455 family protein n=1 Tax=unclassified Roseivivax TaxID=2639302 RepID=UPI001268954F|nr:MULTISPECIES: DUF6455 family protein [unclassified Roseivivax]QFS81298.1 hypothetical protein FIV09_00525 [Roseivivax sp. THAF197b]QFT45027.1 hypothetical protein FIU97_00440 [Roseivivax sp. THAF40]